MKSNCDTTFPELLSGGEVQRLTGLTPGLWAELFETQRLPPVVEVGGRLKWRKADVIQWVASLKPISATDGIVRADVAQ